MPQRETATVAQRWKEREKTNVRVMIIKKNNTMPTIMSCSHATSRTHNTVREKRANSSATNCPDSTIDYIPAGCLAD